MSYYPGRGQTMHPLSTFPTVPPTVIQDSNLANSDDSGAKSEEGWFNDGHFAGLAEGPPSCISEARAHEVC